MEYIKIRKVAEFFRIKEEDAHALILNHGNLITYKLLNITCEGEYVISRDIYDEIIGSHDALQEHIIQQSELMLTTRETLPEQGVSLVYFLYSDGKLVYIGKSTNIRCRINSHIQEKEFDNVSIYKVGKHILDVVEEINIMHYLPPLNLAVLSQQSYFKRVLRNCSFA